MDAFELHRHVVATINDLRNIVFHFRRGVTPRDTDRLRRFRDKLRYNRELYHFKQRSVPVPADTCPP